MKRERKEKKEICNRTDLSKSEGVTAGIETDNRLLKAEYDRKVAQTAAQEQIINDLKNRLTELSAELENQVQENGRFKQEAQKILHEFMEINRCNITCPVFNLCRKHVLIVGGITCMEALYKRLIEDAGGIFEYHDGYMHGGAKQLESSLKRADIVLCPVSCNSHGACSMVKNLGKKHNKPVHMLASFSLSTVSHVLSQKGDRDI